jgi:hypothetical protein
MFNTSSNLPRDRKSANRAHNVAVMKMVVKSKMGSKPFCVQDVLSMLKRSGMPVCRSFCVGLLSALVRERFIRPTGLKFEVLEKG